MTEDSHDPRYVALIGDIRGSRKIENRSEVQQAFREVIDALNERVPSDAIASPFTVTTGDEFQVLLTEATAAVDAAVAASDRFHPAQLRFGIGRGTLATAVNPDQAIGMDGPCFHRARGAIEDAKQASAWVRVNGWSTETEINVLFDLVQCVREDWTDRQAEFALALTEAGTQTRVAERFDVSKSTVSESLAAGHVQEVRAAEAALAAMLTDGSDAGSR